MGKTIGILIFDDAEELDFVGPFEVFTMARMGLEQRGDEGYDVRVLSERGGEVRGAKGMRFVTDPIASAPPLDVLLIPGGQGTRREVENEPLLEWIAVVAETAGWVTSVCSGAMLLTAAGPARGRRVTTHWSVIETLRQREEAAEVLEHVRYVRDGNVVTAAGVSAGIDMALWLVGQWEGPAFARGVQKLMEYYPAPPHQAEV